VVTVHDTGRGPADRLAGLVPAPGNTRTGGLDWGCGSSTSSTSTSRSGTPATASPSGSAAARYPA